MDAKADLQLGDCDLHLQLHSHVVGVAALDLLGLVVDAGPAFVGAVADSGKHCCDSLLLVVVAGGKYV